MSDKQNYHHGNLKEAFAAAARELLENEGLSGLSLRKCAERVGVSHTAPKNHFGSMAGLLTSIVAQGHAELANRMSESIGDQTPRTERRDIALMGYVAFAEANPALYDLMFSRDRLINDDPELMAEVRKCFLILVDVSRDLGWHIGAETEVDGKGQIALWSFIHGYAQLLTSGRFKKDNMQGLTVLDILPGIGSGS